MQVLTDEDFANGAKLELDVLLPDGSTVRCWAEVVWQARLGDGAAAASEVGLRFIDMAPDDVQRLASVLTRRP